MKNNYNRLKGNYKRRNESNNKTEIFLKCPICDRPIRILHNAICQKDTLDPVHFNCVLKELEVSEELAENESICYLGKGSFGIISLRHSSSPIPFLIKKRIQYEKPEEIPEWRKKIHIYTKSKMVSS